MQSPKTHINGARVQEEKLLYASLMKISIKRRRLLRNHKKRVQGAHVFVSLFLDGRGGGLDVVGQPSQTLEETLAGGGTAGHNVPDLVLELGELQSFGDFLG